MKQASQRRRLESKSDKLRRKISFRFLARLKVFVNFISSARARKYIKKKKQRRNMHKTLTW